MSVKEQKQAHAAPHAVFYETVMDCITKEQRRAGIVGRLKTIEFTKAVRPVDGENRNKSMEAFQKIFKGRSWYKDKDNPQSASGAGSLIQSTAEAMAGLHVVITELKKFLGVSRIRMLDIPCGDMVWMSRFLDSREDVNYTGIDIVPDIISDHQKRYVNRPWTFIHKDIITQGVGAQYDLIFSRQMLQHILSSDVISFLQQAGRGVTICMLSETVLGETPCGILPSTVPLYPGSFSLVSRSGSKYLLATSFQYRQKNPELVLTQFGRYRPLNLEAPPISLAPPLCFFRDGPDPAKQIHSLMLYKLPLRQVVGCTEAKSMKIIKSISKPNAYFSCGNWSV